MQERGNPGHNRTMPPVIHVTDAAAAVVRQAARDGAALRLTISPAFQYELRLDIPREGDSIVAANGLDLVLDADSVGRADGLTLDYETDETGESGFTIDNPNAPAPVFEITPEELKELLASDEEFRLLDVRSPAERAIGKIDGSELLDEALHDELMTLDRETLLVFYCHHGVRSQAAAQYFQRAGFRRLCNLAGGIEAWSLRVDPSVPRY